MSILVSCVYKKKVKSQKSKKVCLVRCQSVSEMFLWIDIFFLVKPLKLKKAKSVFFSLMSIKLLSFSSFCLSVKFVLSQVCVKNWFCLFVVVCELFIFRVNHMPPASLIPIFGIGRARHLSTFLLPFHFSGTIFTSNAWID